MSDPTPHDNNGQREAAISFTINGKTVPATLCTWYEIEPCGCTSGCISAVSGSEVYATEGQVLRELYPRKKERDAEIKAGVRVELGLRTEVQARLGAGTDCTHEPKWGRS